MCDKTTPGQTEPESAVLPLLNSARLSLERRCKGTVFGCNLLKKAKSPQMIPPKLAAYDARS